MAERTAQVNIRLEQSLKEAAERAAVLDHRSLTSFIEKLIIDHLRSEADLHDWHLGAIAKYSSLLGPAETTARGFLARSYFIRSKLGFEIKPNTIISLLGLVHANLGNLIGSPHIFYPYTRPELRPYFTSDPRLKRGSSIEILECAAQSPTVSEPSLWRISPTGLAAEVRPHFEDVANVAAPKDVQWFAPYHFTHHIAELVLHALVLSEHIKDAESIEFRCEWTGLGDRQLAAFDHANSFRLLGKIAHSDSRVTKGVWDVEQVRREWPDIVGALGAPVMRLFDPLLDYSGHIVRDLIPELKRF
jgi:hypothetical protein